ncbi:MAG TPA: fumarylacetoacetate hydrolase family protein [Rugosimonospora sp.]|nr:fumarylacetoacetate hydrolase family protein [Rugosimonospora sp.]
MPPIHVPPTAVPPAHVGPFALGTFAAPVGRPFAGLVTGEVVRELPGTVLDLLADWDAALPRLGELATRVGGTRWRLDDLRVLPPLAPGQVLQSGANYRQHVVDLVAAERHSVHGRTTAEARADAEAMMDERIARGTPYVFLGSTRAVCGAYDDVRLPARGGQHDWELELAAVIGRPAWRVPRSEALAHVAGYTICNDLTTRDLVHRADLKGIGTDWYASKNAPTFLPTGPYLVPAAFVGNPMDLRITLRHNGVTRQDESTKDMIFDVARLVEYASSVQPLLPGDLLLTGSPAGNGAASGVFLTAGDVLEGEISGLGGQRNRCVGTED